jgi:hypothetical protein
MRENEEILVTEAEQLLEISNKQAKFFFHYLSHFRKNKIGNSKDGDNIAYFIKE